MTDNFVLATDEVWRLQGGMDGRKYRAAGGDDPECLCFQKMAGSGHYGAGGGTKQGIYVCTPGGKFLASINSSSPKSVMNMLERGLAAWQKLPEKTRAEKPPFDQPQHRWEQSYPQDGLVLKETVRYLSEDKNDDPKNIESRFNFDFAWFSGEETKQFIPETPKVGQKYKVPQKLYLRLARHHLLNTAQGESGSYHDHELTGELRVEVLSVDQQKVRIRISGTSQAIAQTKHDAHWRARRIDAKLLGFADFNRVTQKFDKFDLVAKGKIFPKAKPEVDAKGVRSIGWYFTLADPDQGGAKISPTHLYAYTGNWVKKPVIALHDLRRRSDKQKMKMNK
jgi:hypothetical protein